MAPSGRASRMTNVCFAGKNGHIAGVTPFPLASKTLILADTIINIELDKVTEPWRTATKFTGMYHPYGRIFFGMRLPLFLQRRKAEEAIRKIHAWQPQRILLSHGRCFDADADKVIHRIFGEPSR